MKLLDKGISIKINLVKKYKKLYNKWKKLKKTSMISLIALVRQKNPKILVPEKLPNPTKK